MTEIMTFAHAIAFNIVVGLVLFQLLTWLLPFRKISARRELVWDAIALPLSIGFFMVYHPTIEQGYHSLIVSSSWMSQASAWLTSLPLAAKIIIAMLAADFFAYWTHRLMHTPLIWPIHVHHHSAKHLYWLSGLRSSWLNLLVISTPYSFIILMCEGSTVGPVDVFYLLQQYWVHSNINLPIGPLKYIIITPDYHFVHHAAKQSISETNFGSVFTFWDRIFGTYKDPATVPKDTELGLDTSVRLTRSVFGLPSDPVPTVAVAYSGQSNSPT
jgi:sterol desaturase/sphingolipid hydroxylase (fatty acid hydroxylase superfamily)